jgi:endonuclease YncB( thermonuclease family)
VTPPPSGPFAARWLARPSTGLALAAAMVFAACGSDSPSAPSPPPTSPGTPNATVSSITDGDTLRFSPAIEGTMILRMLHIDAPESAQAPWGAQARSELLRLAPAGTVMQIAIEETRVDAFGRLLGHAIRSDGVDLNREQLRAGQAVLYVIWPNVSRFEDYRAAEIEAQAAGRGIWNSSAPLTELPFEYRLRLDRDTPFRPVGDYFTRLFVEPADYTRVHVNNRVFFNNRNDAAAAGYTACPRSNAGEYASSCFAPGVRSLSLARGSRFGFAVRHEVARNNRIQPARTREPASREPAIRGSRHSQEKCPGHEP